MVAFGSWHVQITHPPTSCRAPPRSVLLISRLERRGEREGAHDDEYPCTDAHNRKKFEMCHSINSQITTFMQRQERARPHASQPSRPHNPTTYCPSHDQSTDIRHTHTDINVREGWTWHVRKLRLRSAREL
jgi:hypothetical protein